MSDENVPDEIVNENLTKNNNLGIMGSPGKTKLAPIPNAPQPNLSKNALIKVPQSSAMNPAGPSSGMGQMGVKMPSMGGIKGM